MPITPESKNLMERLSTKLPVDATAGISVANASPALMPNSPYMTQLKAASVTAAENASAYYNQTPRTNGPQKKPRGTPKKVISPDGFPPGIKVSYVDPAPRSGYVMSQERDVKFFVMHSFGHGWHAMRSSGQLAGWLNSAKGNRGVVPFEYENRTIYIAKGSDPETMHHYSRFTNGMQSTLQSAAKAGAHFFIDRNGNLVVVGDCNNVMFTTKKLNKVQLGVEMEEALYTLTDTKGKRNKANWKPGGNPAGTAGTNIEYFSYSVPQLLTLSILVKKLETVYPQLRERNVYLGARSMDKNSAPGYTMHNAVKGNHHIDISPHFLEQSLWDSFFDLVDSHTHINPTNVFKAYQRYADTNVTPIQDPTADEGITPTTDRLLQDAKDRGVALKRSSALAQATRKSSNEAAGKNAARESQQLSQNASNISQVAQGTQSTPTLPSETQPLDTDGTQANSSNDWG